MRWALASLAGALMLAVAACDGDATPPASTAVDDSAAAVAAPAPARTSTPSPEPTPSLTPAPTPTPSPTPVSTPTPSPTSGPTPASTAVPDATSEPTPTPTPEPHGIEFKPITRGEPRPLPEGLALYYAVWPCNQCDSGPSDIRRVVFDGGAGAFREDRPLAFFDGATARGYYPLRRVLGVSESGQTLAARICHAGFCEVDGLDGAYPSADAELRLWVTRDGGRMWEDWGQLLPNTGIAEVTDDDVLVWTRNIWHAREDWDRLTNKEWEEMLAHLALLGLDEREGWDERFRWVASGEAHSTPPGPTPPTVGGLDWWLVGTRPDGTVAWSAAAQGDYLLAITDQEGSVGRVYGATDWVDGSFIADDLLVRSIFLPDSRGWIQIAAVDLIDLATSTVHEVEGLTLPLGFDPEMGGPQRGYYHLIAARPAPDRPRGEYRPLK